MCGIVAVLDQAGRRRSDARAAERDRSADARRPPSHALGWPTPARRRSCSTRGRHAAEADAAAAGRPRRAGPRRPAGAGRRHRGPARPARRVRGRRGGPASSRRRRRRRPPTSSGPTPRSIRAEGRRCGRCGRDRLRTAAAVADLAGRDAGASRAGRLPVDPAGAVGHRPARGPRPRLGRPAPVRAGTTGSTSTTRSWPPASARRGDDPLFPSGAVRVADGAPVVRLQGGGRDRRARRQHRRAAGRDRAATRCCTWRSPRRRRGSPCSATPAGPASASSPSPTPTRSTARRTRAPGGPYVVAVLNGDVDNHADLRARAELSHPDRRSRPTPRSSPPSCRARR